MTAEKKSAIPLALVTANLLERLPAFPNIFFAKLVQRSGGWPVPSIIPSIDADGTAWADATRMKAMGYRVSNSEQETMGEYVTRISGMMRVYFLVLAAPVAKPLDNMFRLPRYWTYFARMMNDERLLSTAVAAQLLYGMCFWRRTSPMMTDRTTQLRSMWVEWRRSVYGGNSGSSSSRSCTRLLQWALGVKVTPPWVVRLLKAKRHASVFSSRSRISFGADSATGFDAIGMPRPSGGNLTPPVVLILEQKGTGIELG